MTLYRKQGSRPSPKKLHVKKAKWLSEEACQIAEKRREAKSKGEKERYIHLNAEFQRILFCPELVNPNQFCPLLCSSLHEIFLLYL